MQPIISIITPTFNQSQFISACIESVLNQTYSNWEMIIIDDCSSDDTERIVRDYMKNDSRIRYVRHHKNWGVARLADTYNQGLKSSQGDYIAILEGDDLWPCDKLERQLRDFGNKEVVLSYGDWVIIDRLNKKYYLGVYNHRCSQLNNLPRGSILHLFAQLNFSIIPVTIMLRKTALEQIGGFQKDKRYPFIDIPTIFALTAYGEFKYHRSILGYYRKHSGSTWYSHAKNTTANFRNELSEMLKQYGVSIDSSEQLKIIQVKNKRKIETHFLHSIVFGNIPSSQILAKKILQRKQTGVGMKGLAVLFLISPKLADMGIGILYFMQFLRYRYFKINRNE